MRQGCDPDAFKTAVVTHLIKKANLPSDDLKNYRPESGLSFISKLVEHVVAKQLLEHIHVHNLDKPTCQHIKLVNQQTAYLSIKIMFTYPCQEVNPLPWYYSTCLPLLTQVIIPLFSVASVFGLVLVALF